MSTTKTYWEKLTDPRWQRRRLEIMQRDKFQCTLCRDTENQLQVHHKRYHKRTNPWDYPDADLCTLCDTCHKEVTEMKDRIGWLISHPLYYDMFSTIVEFAKIEDSPIRIDHLRFMIGEFMSDPDLLVRTAYELQRRLYPTDEEMEQMEQKALEQRVASAAMNQ